MEFFVVVVVMKLKYVPHILEPSLLLPNPSGKYFLGLGFIRVLPFVHEALL